MSNHTQALIGGRFTLVAEHGRGTSGVVYRAHDRIGNHVVAVKLLHDRKASQPLLQEAALLKSLSHRGIVRIVATGQDPHVGSWLAMEWLEGTSLDQLPKSQPLSLSDSLLLTAELADALQAAHDAGVIHRDIKPANIFLVAQSPNGTSPIQPKLLDFGSAIQLSHGRLVDTGLAGTPDYMAPEQVTGHQAVDARSDLYSLGATLYELLCGSPPHRGPTHLATLARLAVTRPQNLRERLPSVPVAVAEYVHQLLEQHPAARPGSAKEVAAHLRELADSILRESCHELEPRSARFGSSASRILTTIVALDFPTVASRDQALKGLSGRGAEAVPLAQDSLLAHLGARMAQGNEATAALRLGSRLGRRDARVGIATGRALVPFSQLEEPCTPIGEVVDRAIALAREAAPGQVLADATTSELSRGGYDLALRPDGSAIIKGAVAGAGLERAGGTPFVGRDAELGRLKAGFDRALEERHAVLLAITGPPGIGKTRLQREAVARLAACSEIARSVHQRSEAYGRRRALGAAADVIRGLLALPREAEAEACREALIRLAPALAQGDRRNLDVLARLVLRERLQDTQVSGDFRDVLWLQMTQLVEGALREGALLIVSEDLQWTDAESVGWFEHLLSHFADQPLLLLFTGRPGFWTEHGSSLQSHPHILLELQPISGRATLAIAEAVVGRQLPVPDRDELVKRSGGSPLFAEELARLAAAGQDVSRAPNIETAIQASLDGLSLHQREAVAKLSVLGQAGWDEALEALGVADSEQMLVELSAREILVEHANSRFFGFREWHFKHALVQEVAYNSLGPDQRLELHSRAARWLQQVGQDPAIIARHHDLADEAELAARHWASAAKQALATSALADALAMAERALTFAEDGREAFERARILDEAWSRHDDRASDRESAVTALEEHATTAAAHCYAQGARARYEAARGDGNDTDERLLANSRTAENLGLFDEQARCTAPLARLLAFRGDFDRAQQAAAKLLLLGKRPELRAAAVDGWQTLAIVRQSEGALSAALDARRKSAEAARTAGLPERESILTTNLGFALTTVGARREAREHLEVGLQLAQRIGSVGAQRHARMLLLCWAATFGTDRELDATLGETREEADASAGVVWTAPARENLGNLYYRGLELLRKPTPRKLERARSLLKLASESYRQTGNRDVLPVALGMWARAELLTGAADAAATLAQEAADLLGSGAPSLLNEAPVFLVLADAQTQRGRPEQATQAIQLGMTPLLTRLRGLSGTPYIQAFLSELADNASLVSKAETLGVLPDRVRELLGRHAS